MTEVLQKGLIIDGIAGNSAIDSQGEVLNIEGCDISALEQGLGRINDNHSKTFNGQIGRVLNAKKIFKKEDCEDDRQRMYYDKVQNPYIYIKGELYDDEDHANAKAAAAIMKHLNKGGSPLSVKMSVEGAVLARKDGGVLDRTKVHSVALTFTPANKKTLALPVNELEKSESTPDWESLCKSINIISNAPDFIETRDSKYISIVNRVVGIVKEITDLKKALTVGYPQVGNPEGLVGGGVLAMPSVSALYMNCDDCGKRQVVQKNQVTCAFCGKEWSMSKIAKNLIS